MSSSASVFAVVGIPIEEVLTVRVENRVRDRFDPETGERVNFHYEQRIWAICGEDIPIKRKRIVTHDSVSEVPKQGYSLQLEFYDWLVAHGFCHQFLRYYHGYNTSWVCDPTGILGISLWDYTPGKELDNYGWASDKREIDLQQVQERIAQVRPMLENLGCLLEPKLYVIPRLS